MESLFAFTGIDSESSSHTFDWLIISSRFKHFYKRKCFGSLQFWTIHLCANTMAQPSHEWISHQIHTEVRLCILKLQKAQELCVRLYSPQLICLKRLPGQSLFSLKRTWQHRLALQSCVWTTTLLLEQCSYTKVEMFDNNAMSMLDNQQKTNAAYQHCQWSGWRWKCGDLGLFYSQYRPAM